MAVIQFIEFEQEVESVYNHLLNETNVFCVLMTYHRCPQCSRTVTFKVLDLPQQVQAVSKHILVLEDACVQVGLLCQRLCSDEFAPPEQFFGKPKPLLMHLDRLHDQRVQREFLFEWQARQVCAKTVLRVLELLDLLVLDATLFLRQIVRVFVNRVNHFLTHVLHSQVEENTSSL